MARSELVTHASSLAAAVLLGLGSLLPRSGAAQGPANAAVHDSTPAFWSRRLAPYAGTGRVLRVAVRGTGHLSGRLTALGRDSLSLALLQSGAARTVALASVDSVWWRRSHILTGAAITATPCALYGGLVGAFIAGDPDSNGSPDQAPFGAVIGALAGGAVCAVPGAILGWLVPRWTLVAHRAPAQAP